VKTKPGRQQFQSSLAPGASRARRGALGWLSAVALMSLLSACAIEAPGSSRAPSTGGDPGKGPGTLDCSHPICEPGEALDPTCDPCATTVCSIDSFCCEVEWDDLCVGEAEDFCGIDCSAPPACEHPLCDAGSALEPTCDPCATTVCTEDSFCCEVEWDEVCVGEAEQLCGLDCGIEDCSHDLCATGAPLAPTCDPCVEAVCAATPSCCTTSWGEECVTAVEATCGLTCDGGSCGDGVCDDESESCETCPVDCGECGTCEHPLCEAGGPLDPGCDECVADVCAVDSFCCDVEWDDICIGEAEQICGIDCGGAPPAECGNNVCEATEDCVFCPEDCGQCPECPHDTCVEGEALPFGCDACTPNVCKVDSFCCEVAWDSICVELAEEHCALDCEGVCAHELCDTGVPLDPTCDECAGQVCDADPFCCTDLWDRVCVDEAEQLCGLTCE
jgi:hypothetical protein